MTAFNSLEAVSICCLSLEKNMNLRKASSERIRNSTNKNIKSPVKKGRKSKRLSKNPVKFQKPVLNDSLMVRALDINLVTSTPIPHEVRKRKSRLPGKYNSKEITKLNSFNKISSPIISSPIRKTLAEIKPCEIRLYPVKLRGNRYSSERKSDLLLRSNKKSSNDQLSHFSLNSPVKTLIENARLTRNSVTLRSQNSSMKKTSDIGMSLSLKSNSARRISIMPENHLSNNQRSIKKLVLPQNEVQSENKKYLRKSSICAEKLVFPVCSESKNVSSVSAKSNDVLIAKKFLDEDFSETSVDSLFQSDNSKSSRHSLKNSTVPQKKSYSKNKVKNKKKFSSCSEKLVSPFLSIAKKNKSAVDKSNGTSREKKNALNTEKTFHLQVNLSESNNETKTSKSSRYSLRLQNRHLAKTVSNNGLSFKDNLTSQDITKTPKNLFESSSNNTKRSSRSSFRLKSSKTTTMNKSSSNHSLKNTATKTQKFTKDVYRNEASKQFKSSASSSKKHLSSKKSAEKCLSYQENVPIDDLILSVKSPERRKVKSDGFKFPSLKRKRNAIEKVKKAHDDYEDDLYELKKFDQFKELLMDTSDSERSFAISTPKFPVTPLIRHKTPKYKDCYSPNEYAVSRKAAMEYIYRNKRRKNGKKPPGTPVITEKKKLEYSQVLENAQKFQKIVDCMAEEESDNDSYFSFC